MKFFQEGQDCPVVIISGKVASNKFLQLILVRHDGYLANLNFQHFSNFEAKGDDPHCKNGLNRIIMPESKLLLNLYHILFL